MAAAGAQRLRPPLAIRLVAEVQSRHGELLQQLLEDVEPLKVLKDVCETAVRDHEQRITAIEQGAK